MRNFFFIVCVLLVSFSLKAEELGNQFDVAQLKGKKLGYYVGSFDPIHLGHQHLIEEALHQGYVDYVLIYPVPGKDPYKNRTDWSIRQKMVASLYENHPKILFTYWTPKELQDSFALHAAEIEVIGIVGSDVVTDVLIDPKTQSIFMRGIPLKEKHYEDTIGALMALKARSFLVGRRGNVDLSPVAGKIDDRPICGLISSGCSSSTEVRNAIKNGQPFEHLISVPVREIIQQKGLYGYSNK